MKSKLLITLFLIIGFSMFVLPIIYVFYAEYHPTGTDLSWTLLIPDSFIFKAYLSIMELSFILPIVLMIRGVKRGTFGEPTLFLTIGTSMLVVMINFLLFILYHQEIDFPWPIKITFFIYKNYLGIMAVSFILAIVLKVKNVFKKQ